MGENIIDLLNIEAPDCAICEENTKRICGKTFDIEGPGMVGVLYDCDNKKCKNRKMNIELFQLIASGILKF